MSSSNVYGPCQSPNQGMGRRRRNPEPPGNQIPDNRCNQRCNQNLKAVAEFRRIGDLTPDRLGYARKEQRPCEVHHSRHQNRGSWLECTCGHRGSYRIRRIMETVDEVESERQDDDN
ncbi:hypothetical protein D3C86_817950 [compost metagenome]